MEETERSVRTWMTSGREDEVNTTVASIATGQSSLLNVVRALGEYLTNEEDVLRAKGVDFLSQVLEKCPREKVNRQATKVLVNFYCNKLEDSETVIPAVKGFLPLAALPTYTTSDAIDTINALAKHLDMGACVQSTRYTVFSIIDILLANHREALRSMGDDFLKAYISLADGEKDPRNLMLVFSIDRVICIEFDISRQTEELFDIISCYFPIAYSPPKDEPLGITSDDLRKALRLCLNASPLFGQHAVPLFLDKLLAGSPATKRDVLDTITDCAPSYGPRVCRNFAKKLWSSLKLEIFQPIDAETERKALEAAKAVIKTIYGEAHLNKSVEGIAKEICEECIEVMKEPEKSQAIPGTKVIAALASTTNVISTYVISQALPCLMALFRDASEVAHRPQILTLLGVIMTEISSLPDNRPEESLQPYKDEVLGAIITGIKDTNSREAAFNGLLTLIRINDLLSKEELVYVVHNINEVLQDEAGEESGHSLDLLIEVSSRNAELIVDSTLPLLFSTLPDRAPARDAHSERAKCWSTLNRLSRLCVSQPLFETLVIRLTTKLDLACDTGLTGSSTEDLEVTSAYAHAILKTLADTLEVKVSSKHSDIAKYMDRLLPRLFRLFIHLALHPAGVKIMNMRLLEIAGRVITLVVSCASVERQATLARSLHRAFFGADVTALVHDHQQLPKEPVFAPFSSECPSQQKQMVALFSASIVAFHKDVFIPDIEPSTFLQDLQKWYLNSSENDLQRRSIQHLMASLVNKNADVLTPYFSYQLEEVWPNTLSKNETPSRLRLEIITLWRWLTTALLVRDHPVAHHFVDHLLKLFEDDEVGWEAARTVGSCASGGNAILTKRNHAIVRLLFAQKYFNSVFPRLLEEVQGSTRTPYQTANLVALTSLIASIHKSIYVQEMPKLLPLLIRGLDLSDSDIRSSIFDTLLSVASSGGADIVTSEHASTLVSVALRCALSKEGNSTGLRIAALKLLTLLPEVVRYDILHPQKSSVIHGLEKALDDPKRAVRREAVNARTTWFMYKG